MTGGPVDDKPERAARIARAVSERMRELGHTYDSLAEATVEHDPAGKGLSASGIAKIVQGKVAHPQRATARTLERTLGWNGGHIARIAEGRRRSSRAPSGDTANAMDDVIADTADLVEALQLAAASAERILANLKWVRAQRR